MKCSQVSSTAKDDEQEVSDKDVFPYNYYLHPCHFLEASIRAFFKCLGIESPIRSEEEKGTTDEATTQKITPPSTPQLPVQNGAADSSEAADPPSSTTGTTEVDGIASASLRVRIRPPLSPGNGGQTN